MEKIKVSKEMATALESVIILYNNKVDHLVNSHIKGNWVSKMHEPLNTLSRYQLAEILIKGYEIEESVEDKVIARYKENNHRAWITCSSFEQYTMAGFNQGIKYMNDMFDLGLDLNLEETE